MIYIQGQDKRTFMEYKFEWYPEECPTATIVVVQKPFHYLSKGTPNNVREYRKWLFKKLLTDKTASDEFTRLLDIVIQEGDLILKCSCIPPQDCHASVIRDALIWAKSYGIDGWHSELKKKCAKRG